MKNGTEKTAEEMVADDRAAAIARGDIVEGDDELRESDAGANGVVGADDPEGGDDDGDDGDAVGDDDEGAADDSDESDEGAADDGGAAEVAGEGEKPKPIMIPKARFDEAAKKAKDKADALQAKLDKLEKQHTKQTSDTDLDTLRAEIDDLEDKWQSHLLEGELAEAKEMRRQLNSKRDLLSQKQLLQQSQATGNAAVEQIRFDHQLAAVEAKYPSLNPDHEDVNPALIDEINELMAVYQASGYTTSASLHKAVHYVMRDADGPASKDVSIEKSKQGMKARKAVKKALDSSPPNLSKAGRDSDKGGKGDGLPNITKMTPDQFAKYADANPAELARLRGDSLSDEQAAA